jgi:hypothetical protein
VALSFVGTVVFSCVGTVVFSVMFL